VEAHRSSDSHELCGRWSPGKGDSIGDDAGVIGNKRAITTAYGEEILVRRDHVGASIVTTFATCWWRGRGESISDTTNPSSSATVTAERRRRWLDNQFLSVIFRTSNFYPSVQPLKHQILILPFKFSLTDTLCVARNFSGLEIQPYGSRPSIASNSTLHCFNPSSSSK